MSQVPRYIRCALMLWMHRGARQRDAAWGLFIAAVMLLCGGGGSGPAGSGNPAKAPVATPPVLAQARQGLTGSFGAFSSGFAADSGFDYGFSFYTSIHSLQATPARDTQLGWGTWLRPNPAGFSARPCPDPTAPLPTAYQTIEGGAGVWASGHFPVTMAKFRINSTPDCYKTQIESTAWTFTGSLLPDAKLGLAQLSNRLLVAPDGFVFQAGTSQTLLGYGWLALPFIPAYVSPLGVPTGDQGWTLFFNTANFTGPVAFFVPETYSAVHAANGTASTGLDTRSTLVHSASMELGQTRSITSTDAAGTKYLRIPRLTFPVDAQGRALLIQDPHRYSKAALWDAVARWRAGGAAPTQIAAAGTSSPVFNRDQTVVRILGTDATDVMSFSVARFTTPGGGQAMGMRWGNGLEPGVLPEYYKNVNGRWVAVPASQVPPETWLKDQTFAPAVSSTLPAVNQAAGSPWSSANWKAGPFTATLSDGYTVQYVWYKFVEQPAIARLGLSASVLNQLQAFVETLHDRMGVTGLTIAAPTSGVLATLDPAQIVVPPPGLTRGYVPIVIHQQ